MTKKIFIITMLLTIFTKVEAVDFSILEYAVGFNLGTDKGISLLTHNRKGHGFQANISLDLYDPTNKIDFSIDRLFFMDIGPGIPTYSGFGIKVSDSKGKYFGLRGVAGASFFVNQLDDDLEVFFHLAPTIYFSDFQNLIDMEYGIGARYYF